MRSVKDLMNLRECFPTKKGPGKTHLSSTNISPRKFYRFYRINTEEENFATR